MVIKRSMKLFIVLMVVLILTAATYAFAYANTLPASTYAGDGNVSVSGITVTNVQYTLSLTNDPNTTYVTGVTLTLNSAAPGNTVQIKLVAAGTTWYTCTNPGTTTITCDTSAPSVTVTAADNLRVIVK